MEPYQFHSGLNDIRMQQNDHPGGDQRSWNMMSYLTLSYLIVVYYPLIIHGLVKNPQDFDDFPSDSKKPTSMASSEISQLHMFDHRKVLYCILLYHILPISEGPRAQTSFWEFPEVHLKGHPNTWSRACIYNPTWNFTTKEASVFGNALKKARLLRGFGHWSSLHLGMCTIFPSKDQGKKHIIPQKDTQIFPYSLCVGFDFLFFLGLVQTRACHQGDLYKLNSGKLNHDLRYPGKASCIVSRMVLMYCVLFVQIAQALCKTMQDLNYQVYPGDLCRYGKLWKETEHHFATALVWLTKSVGRMWWHRVTPLVLGDAKTFTLRQDCNTGWWFGTFVIFPYIGNNNPNWLIFFRGVETTNQNKKCRQYK